MYRVQLESRVPEGGRIRVLDFYISEPEFVSPASLSMHRSRVDIVVTPICAEKAGIALTPAKGGRFYIDTERGCPSVEGLVASADSAGLKVRWKHSPGATLYEARIFSASDGALAFQSVASGGELTIPGSVQSPAVLALRALCAGGYGSSVFLLF